MLDRQVAAVMRAAAAFEARALTLPRLRLAAWLVLATIGIIFAWALLSGASVARPDGTPSLADFAFIYASGAVAASPDPAAVYDHTAFAAVQAGLFGAPAAGLPYYYFLYPPSFLLLTRGVAVLPFFIAFAVWLGGTFLLYLYAARTILPQAAILVPAAMPLALLKNAQLGQNGFLTAGAIGLGLALAERQPVLAGGLIGLLSYKPQFGVLFPLALIAGGCWRVAASAAVTMLILAAGAAVAFGHDVWPAYVASLGGFDTRLSPDRGVSFQYQSVFGLVQSLGASSGVAWRLQAVAAVAVVVVVCAFWLRGAPQALRAAVLCIGAAAVTPYVLTYDLCLLAVAAAFLVQDGVTRGFLPGERLLLVLCWAAALLIAMPIGPVLYAVLIGIALWRWAALPAAAGQPVPAAAAAAGLLAPPRGSSRRARSVNRRFA